MHTEKLVYGQDEELRPFLSEPVSVLCGDGNTYEISPERIGSGGEAQVFAASLAGSEERFAAKLIPMDTYIPATEQVRKLLKPENDPLRHNLMPLLATGELTVPDRYTVDLLPLVPGGPIRGKLSYAELKETVRALLTAIRYLHGNGVVHRDIKPGNIYRYRGKIVLGDFGSAVDRGYSELYSGTNGYTAHEARKAAGNKYDFPADYFSLGLTIATLYHGQHVYENLLNNDENVASFESKISEGLIPLNCPGNERDIQILVNALAQYNPNDRAGAEDVQLWLDDRDAFVGKWSSSAQKRTGFSMRFCGGTWYSEAALANAVVKHWQEAKNNFYEDDTLDDDDRFRGLFSLASGRNGARFYDQALRKPPRTVEEQNCTLAKFLFLITCTKDVRNPPIYWDRVKYTGLGEIAADIQNNRNLVQVTEILHSGFLVWYLKKLQENGIAVDDTMIRTAQLLQDALHCGVYFSLQAFAVLVRRSEAKQNRTVDDAISCILAERKPILELCRLYEGKKPTGRPADSVFDAVYRPLLEAGQLYAALMLDRQWLAAKDPDKIKGETAVKRCINHVNHAFAVLEGIAGDKHFVREKYLQYGPYSPTYYVYAHLDWYLPVTDAAKKTLQTILDEKQYPVGSAYPVEKNLTSLQRLSAAMKAISEGMQTDFLAGVLKQYGTFSFCPVEYNALRSNADDAFLKEQLLESGQLITVGFKKECGWVYYASGIENYIKRFLEGENGYWDDPKEELLAAIFDSRTLTRTRPFTTEELLEKTAPLKQLFFTYFSNRFVKQEDYKLQDAYAFAVSVAERLAAFETRLGQKLGASNSRRYLLLCLYDIIQSGITEANAKAGGLYDSFAQSKAAWEDLGRRFREARDSEYETLLANKTLPYDTLIARNPGDYRPKWRKFLDEMEIRKRNCCDCKASMKAYRDAELAFNATPEHRITDGDFDNMIRLAGAAKAAYERDAQRFEAELTAAEPRRQALLRAAGSHAKELEADWERFTESGRAIYRVDFDKKIQSWQSEKWLSNGLCGNCGGRISLFGRVCKSCGAPASRQS